MHRRVFAYRVRTTSNPQGRFPGRRDRAPDIPFPKLSPDVIHSGIHRLIHGYRRGFPDLRRLWSWLDTNAHHSYWSVVTSSGNPPHPGSRFEGAL